MTNQDAKIDGNGVRTILGTFQDDGATLVNLKINPSTGHAKAADGTTGTASARRNAGRDGNSHPAWMGVSSSDGVTPVPVAFDGDGNILIQST